MKTPFESVAVGLHKGFKTQAYEKAKARPSYQKGKQSKQAAHVRALIKEVVGISPYEKRMIDLLKAGASGTEKKVYKYAKNRLGTHKRAMKKREAVKIILEHMKRKTHH